MSAAPAVLHLDGTRGMAAPIRWGDDYSHSIRFQDADGNPISKLGAVWRCQLREHPGSSATAAVFSVALSGAGDNIVTFSLSDSVTEDLVPGKYAWDLEETAAGVTTTRAAGRALVLRDVSRTP